jgi:hypothetical protein
VRAARTVLAAVALVALGATGATVAHGHSAPPEDPVYATCVGQGYAFAMHGRPHLAQLCNTWNLSQAAVYVATHHK